MTNIEQRARDLLNEAEGFECYMGDDTRDRYPSLEAVCRALEAHDETQAAFDAYRREVSDACKDAAPHLSRFIIPEPVDPLTAALDELGVDRDVFDAALAKIGGKVVFGEGA